MSRFRRAILATAFATCFVTAWLSPPASAHVSIEPKSVQPGSVRLAFRIPHGCDGSSTHTVRIKIPEGVIGVKPAAKPGWTVTTEKARYSRSYDYFHGKTLSEGVVQIIWSGGALADDMFDEFLVMAFVSGIHQPGSAIAFPVTQDCEKGSLQWTETATAGADPHALKFPAPLLQIVGDVETARLTVASAWARPTPGGATVGAGYLDIKNATAKGDRLLSASSTVAGRVEIHATEIADGIAKMRKLDDGAVVDGQSVLAFKPGGHHLMFVDLTAPLVEGQSFDVMLTFEAAGTLRVPFIVRSSPATDTPHATHQH